MIVGRIEGVQQGQAAIVQGHARRPQAGQFAQQKARLIGAGVETRMRPEDDLPSAGAGRLFKRRQGGEIRQGRQVGQIGQAGGRLEGGQVEGDGREAEIVVLGHVLRRDRSRSAVGQDFQLGDQARRARRIDRRSGAARRRHVIGQDVGRAQQGPHRRLVAGLPARAQFVHQGLEDVGEAHQVLQPEGARPALDRMDGAKDGVDNLDVGRTGLERQQIALQVGEQLLALLEEGRLDRLERIVAHRPASPPLALTPPPGARRRPGARDRTA
ncbi:hypothetical protein D3C73_508410 [compost metagenome]